MNVDDTGWMKKAYCVGANPEIFFEVGNEDTAKAYCRRCTVRGDCRDWALKNTPHGVWGNTSESERRALLRGNHRASCPGCRGQNIFSDGTYQICVGCGLSWLL